MAADEDTGAPSTWGSRHEHGTGRRPAGIDASERLGTWATLRRGLDALARAASRHRRHARPGAGRRPLGRVVVPFVVQQTIDRGILADGGPDPASCCGCVARRRSRRRAHGRHVVRRQRAPVPRLRERPGDACGPTAFRHVHDLSVLTQNTERRGSLVSRVTSDVDTISMFVQFGGLMLIVSLGQLTVATILMVVYCPAAGRGRLGLLRAAVPPRCAASRGWSRRPTPWCASASASMLRRRLGVGRRCGHHPRVRRGGAHRGADRRGDREPPPLGGQRPDQGRRSRSPPGSWSSGPDDRRRHRRRHPARRCDGQLTLGELLAFLFLVQLFTQPVQTATEILNEMQNAVAGWRRVIGGHRHPGRRGRPRGEAGRGCRAGRSPSTSTACGYAYPAAPPSSATSTCGSRRAAGSPSWGRPARARPRWPSCSPG